MPEHISWYNHPPPPELTARTILLIFKQNTATRHSDCARKSPGFILLKINKKK
jgi:hypothetical protein